MSQNKKTSLEIQAASAARHEPTPGNRSKEYWRSTHGFDNIMDGKDLEREQNMVKVA